MPALPLEEAGRYVAAAYVVFVALLAVYVAIMAAKLARIDSELQDLTRAVEETEPRQGPDSVDASTAASSPPRSRHPSATASPSGEPDTATG